MLAPLLADFLRARRADCNARFAAARRRWPRLDATDFSLFLRDQLSPLANALDSNSLAQSQLVLDQAYDLGLQLVAEKLAGPAATSSGINSVWTEVFPSISGLIATAPRRILGALGNAAHHLEATPATRSDSWRSKLVSLATRCETADEFLIVSQVLAWRSGLAHLRNSAIAAADALPPDLALEIFNAPDGQSWSEVRAAHLADPWFGYDPNRRPFMPSKLTRRIGAFRGFGGPFLSPPIATQSGSYILIRSGDEAWILLGDAFGATLHRAAPEEIAEALPVKPPSNNDIKLPQGHIATSSVVLAGTHVVTSGQSHTIWVGPAIAER